jgi:predicted esterase
MLIPKLAFILLLLGPVCSIHATEQISKEKIESQGKQRTYYLFVPESSQTTTTRSLVVLLHGSGRNGLSLVEKWKDLASKEGFIIVGPDCLSGGGWQTPQDGPEFIHDLVEMLIKKFSIEPHHIYLFGHSAGAVFGLDLAMSESEYFAAVAVHAGSWRSKEEFTSLELAKRKTPIKIIVGDRDMFFPLDSVRATEKALREREFPIEVSVMKGHDHWYYDLAPDINRNAWEFLKQNVLPGDPRHVEYKSTGITADASVSLNQINALRLEAEKLNEQVYAKEGEISVKDRVKEKTAISDIVRTQILLLDECARLLREAAVMADRASKLKLPSKEQQCFSLIATACVKRADAFELIRARSELLLTEGEISSTNMKRNELAAKANILNDEALALEKKAAALLR